MKASWQKITLRDLQQKGLAHIQTGPFGTVLSASEYSNSGVPVISVGEIREGYLSVSQKTPMVSETITERLPQFILVAGDIVFGRKGAINRNSVVNENQAGWFLGSDGIRLRLSKEINSNFVGYQLRSDSVGKWLLQNGSGSIMPSLNQKILDRLPLWLPKIDVQNRIAETLTSIENKIELNKLMNSQLEGMAKLLYDYWFVQFDFPISEEQAIAMVKPELKGKPYKSSGGAMVYNEQLKREVPKGWEDGSLLDVATFTNGIACQKYRPKDNEDRYRVIKIREMGEGFTSKSEFVSKKIPEKFIVKNGDVLFSWSATLDVKIWSGGIGGLNQHIFKITSSRFPRSFYYYETLGYLQYFKKVAELRKTTMGHITRDHLDQSRITIPPVSLTYLLDSIIDPIIKKININQEENQNLSNLRDWLLPMLMNGQVKVSSGVKEEYKKEVSMAAEGEEG